MGTHVMPYCIAAAIAPTLRQVQVFPNPTHDDINLQTGCREAMREFLAAP